MHIEIMFFFTSLSDFLRPYMGTFDGLDMFQLLFVCVSPKQSKRAQNDPKIVPIFHKITKNVLFVLYLAILCYSGYPWIIYNNIG